ncbi:stage II sporulation protein R [Eubacteriales bacterium OttesenSCG-928-M02]|nr:stage II sporulation protein R [Eubacteriales bacterium OttesenSCG-928-M02]
MKRLFAILMMALFTLGVGMDAMEIPPVLRLHVIANSDSEEDQRVKLLVRDALIERMEGAADLENLGQAAAYAQAHMAELEGVANQVLAQQGMGYRATLKLGIYPIPEKQYGEMVFPEGDYFALKVELGSAVGENWWCVLFPPLCFIETVQVDEGWVEEDGVAYKSILWEWLKK